MERGLRVKIEFRQKKIGWCCPLTLANVFRNESFLEYLKEEKYKGCSDDDVKFMIQNTIHESHSVKNIAEVNTDYGFLPIDTVWKILNKKEDLSEFSDRLPLVPYFMSVKLSEYWHFVAVLSFNGKLYYVDPYKENVVLLESKDQLQSYFKYVNLIQRLTIIKDGVECWGVMFGDHYNYTELKD